MTLRFLSRAAFALALGFAATPALATSWTVDRDASTLGFTVPQGDEPLSGTFGSWSADIDFDPENVSAAKISASIDTGSVMTGNQQFDSMLPSPDWFNAEAFPAAKFTSETVTSLGGNAYRAEGNLTIRDISQPATLDFTLDIDGDTAHAEGTATVDRIAHKIGSSVGPAQVGESVTITIDLRASR
jgi:polyisoprenoid-binding protein YceI